MHPHLDNVKSHMSKPLSQLVFLITKIGSKEDGKYDKVEEGKQIQLTWTKMRDRALTFQIRNFSIGDDT